MSVPDEARRDPAAPTPAVTPALASWIAAFVATESRAEQVDAWVRRTTEAILEEMPELARDADLTHVLEQAVREHWVSFLAAFPQPRLDFHLVESGRLLVEEVAQRQLPLEAAIKIYRVAQQESWSYATGILAEVPATELDHTEVLIYFWTRAGEWIDASISASIEIYHAERIRVMAGSAAQRYEVVREVLEGADEDPRRLSASLGGYPLSATHTALVLTTRDQGSVSLLEERAASLARLLGPGQRLLVQPGGRQLWLWVATRDAPALDVLTQASADLRAEGLTVGVGAPAAGQAGFVSSHQDAVAAQAMAVRSGEPGGLVRYADVELVSLLGCDERVDRFMTRVLGPLAADDDGSARTRETLEVYLRCGGNVEEAARALSVHRNTVRYRIAQAEEQLGRPVKGTAADLGVALRHHAGFHTPAGRSD